MAPSNKQIDPQTLNALLTLDEQLRSGRLSEGVSTQVSENDDQLLRTGLEALLELEAAIPRQHQSMPSWAPRTIGRFELKSVLGAGGFAVVYLAHDPQLLRDVALKVPRPHALIQPELRQRFVNEARATARLDHPAIVPVFEAGSDGDLPFLACALCEGPTLEKWISSRDGLMNAKLAAELVVQLADGLQYSHERGILHRDIKPGNVLLFPAPAASHAEFPFVARISDFGLAKLLEDPQLDNITSQLIGTPRFMAPELLKGTGRTSSVAADIYAMGAVLYTMLTGHAPFASASLAETMKSIAADDPVPPELLNRSVGRDLSLICLKCLEKSPSARYASAAELRDDLNRFLSGQCVQARQTPPIVRMEKWCRRHPLRAAFVTMSMLFLAATAVVTYRYAVSMQQLQNRLRDTNGELSNRVHELDNAVRQAKLSQSQATEERRLTRKLLQIADINLAGRMWKQGDTKGAQALLTPWITASPALGDSLAPSDIALSYIRNRITVPSITWRRTSQSIWWMHPDVQSGKLILARSDGNLELISRKTSDAYADSRLDDILKATSTEMTCISISDDRALAATSGDDGCVRVWKLPPDGDLTAAKFLLAHELRVLPESSVYNVLFLPGSHQFLCCARTPVLSVWDGDTGKPVRKVETGHPRFIESLVMSPYRSLLATAGADGMLEILQIPDLKSVRQIRACEKPLSMSAFSSDGRLLACGGWDKLLRVYDVQTGRQIGNYLSLAGIYCVTGNPDNEVLVGDRDGTLTLFRLPHTYEIVEEGAPVPLLKPEKRWAGHSAPVSAICWAPDSTGDSTTGTWISADRHGEVKSWNIGPPSLVTFTLPLARSDPSQLLLPAGSFNLCGSDRGIDVYRNRSEAVEQHIPTKAKVTCLTEIGDGRIAAGDADGNLYCIQQSTSGHAVAGHVCVSQGHPIVRILGSPGQNGLCVIDGDWRLHVVDFGSETIRKSLENSRVAAITPDGNTLVHTLSGSDEILVRRISDGEILHTMRGHQSTVSRILVTPDGRTCITSSHDRTICVWDLQTHTLRKQLTGHGSAISALTLSPAADLLASVDEAGIIRLWDIVSGRELTELDERIPAMIDLRFLENGRKLIAWTNEPKFYEIAL